MAPYDFLGKRSNYLLYDLSRPGLSSSRHPLYKFCSQGTINPPLTIFQLLCPLPSFKNPTQNPKASYWCLRTQGSKKLLILNSSSSRKTFTKFYSATQWWEREAHSKDKGNVDGGHVREHQGAWSGLIPWDEWEVPVQRSMAAHTRFSRLLS